MASGSCDRRSDAFLSQNADTGSWRGRLSGMSPSRELTHDLESNGLPLSVPTPTAELRGQPHRRIVIE